MAKAISDQYSHLPQMTNQLYRAIRQLAALVAAANFLSASPTFAFPDSSGPACATLDPTIIRAVKYDSAEAVGALMEYELDARLERRNKGDLDVIRQHGIAEWRRLTKAQMLVNPPPGACTPFPYFWYAVNYGNVSVTKLLLSQGADPITWDQDSYKRSSKYSNYFVDCGRYAGRPKELKSELRQEYLARIRTTYGLLAAQAENTHGTVRLQESLRLASEEPQCEQEDGFYKELMLELIDKSRRRELRP